ncbi:MAG TPA: potassium-transporting ATPase subunit KdpA, partial [Euzebyales bacterium]
MQVHNWLQFAVVAGLFVVLTPPLGAYMARVYGGGRAPGERIFGPVDRMIYRLCGIDASREQRSTTYALSFVAFSLMSWLALYAIQRLQGLLPLNPTDMSGVSPDLAFNTAMSFTSNTNWQNYSGEATLSHLTQMTGLTVQNFVSAAAGMAVLAAVIRGLARTRSDTVGNFWVDLVRTTTRILLPLSFVVALVLVSRGVIQNLDGFTQATTLEGGRQTLPGGPVASQIAIKQLGTNGGGFFGSNSAVPYENSTPLVNLVELVAIGVIPFALTATFGRMIGNRRQGWVLFAVMFILWAGSAVAAMVFEAQGNPRLTALGVDQAATELQAGGNMEGKEVRFGPAASALWAATTTGTSNGSVNSMHDSYTPLGGGVTTLNMLLGEVSPGGVGVGLMGLLILAILSVFIAGLMVGRTPEFLGKKIEPGEMKVVTLYILAVPLVVLVFTAASVLLPSAVAQAGNAPGPHGLTEVLYGFASPGNNNGSAFVGLSSNTPWFNSTQGIAFVFGRWLLIVPALAVAGSLVRKQPVPASTGTFPTDGATFGILLLGVTLILVGLTYFPVLSLGPIAE